MVRNIFRQLEPINLSYRIGYTNRRITHAYVSRGHSKFIYTETQIAFYFTVCTVTSKNWPQYLRLKNECSTFCNVGSHFDHPNKRPVFTRVLGIRNAPLCLYVSELHVTCCSDCKYVVLMTSVYLLTCCHSLLPYTFIC